MSMPRRCIVCGSTTFRPFLGRCRDRMFEGSETFSYERCASCGLVRQHPQLSDKQLKAYYPSRAYYAYQEQASPGFFDRIRSYLLAHYYHPTILTRLITALIPNVPAIPSFVRRGRVLDVGCGTGDTLVSLRSLGWDVYGLDIDESAVKIARRRGLKNASRGHWQNIAKFPDGFFDAVRLYHVIEHLDDPGRCLSLIRKKLKAGGELLVGTPNAGSAVARTFGTYWYNLDAPRHLFLFRPDNLSRLLRSTGFTISSIQFCSAGGILGSVGYLFHRELLSWAWLVMLVYPIDWLLDKLRLGDIFVIRARKGQS